jgi:hypothetical protein
MVTGALAGASCAVFAVNLAIYLDGPYDASFALELGPIVQGAAAIGALSGFILAPVAGFALLRRVPLGRSLAVCTLGTTFGGLLGNWIWPFNPYDADRSPGIVRGAFLGFVLVSVALWAIGRTAPVVAERGPERHGT